MIRTNRWAVLVLGLILSLIIFVPYVAEARGRSVHVRGYYRKNGTYVSPHYRSAPDGNPYNNWSYPGNVNPFTGEVASGNTSTYLFNYYNHTPRTAGSATLVASSPTIKAITANVTAYQFASNTSTHFTRGIERKALNLNFKRLVGQFTNTTGRSMRFAKVYLYRLDENSGEVQEIQSAYVSPATVNPGQTGYYDMSLYNVDAWSNLAVAVTDDSTLASDLTARYFPVSDVNWSEEGKYFKTLKITAKITNASEERVSSIDVLILLKDAEGKLIKIERTYAFGLDPGEAVNVSTSLFSDYEGVASVELVALRP